MSFGIILATSVIVFLIFRITILLLYSGIQKVFKLTDSNLKFSVLLSSAIFLIYIQGFLGAVQGVMGNTNITNLEWYLIYTFIGTSAMIWCYFNWELKWGARPQFAKEEHQMIIKKIIVFFAVMVFAFYQGYTQLEANFGGNQGAEKELLVMVTNITIIPGIIALDRVLNQISIYLKKKRENNL